MLTKNKIIITLRPHHLQIMHEMWPISTDIVHNVVCVDVCVLSTQVSCTKTAEPIKMSFAGLTCVGPRNQALYGGQDQTK